MEGNFPEGNLERGEEEITEKAPVREKKHRQHSQREFARSLSFNEGCNRVLETPVKKRGGGGKTFAPRCCWKQRGNHRARG